VLLNVVLMPVLFNTAPASLVRVARVLF